jgi:hypothetical protein
MKLLRVGGVIVTGETPSIRRETCPSATLSIANLSQCHLVHHKPAPVPPCPSQTCPSATLSITNLSQCHLVHHKPAPVPPCPSQTPHKDFLRLKSGFSGAKRRLSPLWGTNYVRYRRNESGLKFLKAP